MSTPPDEQQDRHRDIIRSVLEHAPMLPLRGARFQQLAKQLHPEFDFRRDGFPTLRRFLDAYPDLVSVTHDGSDLAVVLRGARRDEQIGNEAAPTIVHATFSPATSPAVRIRSDFWGAFTFVDPTLERFYDREADRIIVFSQDHVEGQRRERADVEQNPRRYVRIDGLTSAAHLAFTREFVEHLPEGDAKRTLRSALTKPVWFREFIAYIRRHPDIEVRWRAYRSNFVLDRIREWSARNGLEIPNLVGGALQPRTHGRQEERMPTAPASTSSVRTRILAAIARMSTAQLLQLPIPAEYLLEHE